MRVTRVLSADGVLAALDAVCRTGVTTAVPSGTLRRIVFDGVFVLPGDGSPVSPKALLAF